MIFNGFYFKLHRNDVIYPLTFICRDDPNSNLVRIKPDHEEFEEAFRTILTDCVVQFQDKVFVPNKTLEVVSRRVDEVDTFFLAVNGVEIEPVSLQFDYNTPYILEVTDRGTHAVFDYILLTFCRLYEAVAVIGRRCCITSKSFAG